MVKKLASVIFVFSWEQEISATGSFSIFYKNESYLSHGLFSEGKTLPKFLWVEAHLFIQSCHSFYNFLCKEPISNIIKNYKEVIMTWHSFCKSTQQILDRSQINLKYP